MLTKKENNLRFTSLHDETGTRKTKEDFLQFLDWVTKQSKPKKEFRELIVDVINTSGRWQSSNKIVRIEAQINSFQCHIPLFIFLIYRKGGAFLLLATMKVLKYRKVAVKPNSLIGNPDLSQKERRFLFVF